MTQLESSEAIETVLGSEQPAEESTANWRDGLSDTYKDSESLSSFSTLDDFAKSFIDTKAMVGANTVKIPGKNATDEQKSEFYNALGRPEAADKYEMPTENMPENFQPHEGRLKSMQEAAHAAGLSSQQFAALVRADANMMHELQSGAMQQQEQASKEAMDAIKKEFGEAFQEKDALVQNFLQQFGGEGLPDTIAQSGLFANLDFVKMLVAASEKLADDEIIGSGGSRSFTLSPADAKSKIGALKMDKEFMAAYKDKLNPGHQEAQDKMERLYKTQYPEG